MIDRAALVQLMEEMIPFNRFLGLKVLHIERGLVRIQIPFRDELVGDFMRPALHGGVLSTIVDVAGGFAVWTHLENERSRVSTIDLRVDYLRPGRLAAIIAEARVVRAGNRVGVVDVRVFHPDAEDVTIATGKGVYNIMLAKTELTPRA